MREREILGQTQSGRNISPSPKPEKRDPAPPGDSILLEPGERPLASANNVGPRTGPTVREVVAKRTRLKR